MTFRPLLLPSVMTAVLLPILCGLGWWQLERLEWKTALLDRMSAQLARAKPDVVYINDLRKIEQDCEAHEYRLIRSGKVYMPYIALVSTARSGRLADRIFAPYRLKDRYEDPGVIVLWDFGTDSGPSMIISLISTGPHRETGIVRCSRTPGRFTPDPDLKAGRWFAPNIPEMAEWLLNNPKIPEWSLADPKRAKRLWMDTEIHTNYYIQAEEPHFVLGSKPWSSARLKKIYDAIPNNHFAYAITWFSFALTLVVIYIVFHIREGRLGLK